MRRLTPLAAFLLVPLTTWCTADLADGNPCHAAYAAYCKWAAGCGFLSGGQSADDCLNNAANNKYSSHVVTVGPYGYTDTLKCSISADDARSCATAIEGLDCTASVPPASCNNANLSPPSPSSGDDGGGGSGGSSSGFSGSSGFGGSTGSSSGFGSGTSSGPVMPSVYTPSPTCSTLLANVAASPYVSPQATCNSGVSTSPGRSWVSNDPYYSYCAGADGDVARAIAECASAACSGQWNDAASAASSDQAGVQDANLACSAAASNPSIVCSFAKLGLWSCP